MFVFVYADLWRFDPFSRAGYVSDAGQILHRGHGIIALDTSDVFNNNANQYYAMLRTSFVFFLMTTIYMRTRHFAKK